jgi:hypothetical protein
MDKGLCIGRGVELDDPADLWNVHSPEARKTET